MSSSAPWVSEWGLDAVMRQLPVAVMVVEAASYRVVEFNDRARGMAERQIGRPVAERLEEGWEIFHPDGRPYLMEEWPVVRSITSGEQVDGEEYFNLRPDGSRLFVRCSSSPISDDQGEIVAGVLVMEDITERKRAEEALREARRQTETVLESITDFFVAVDRDWRHTYLNRRVLQGIRKARGEDVSLEDLIGRNIWEVNPELVGTTIDREFHRAVREQRTVVFESCSPVTGRRMKLHAYPIKDGGLSVYARDISERQEAEEQLQRKVRQQEAVAQLGLKALDDWSLRPLMDEAVALVCHTLGVEYAKIDELLPGGEQLLVSAGAGWREGVVGSATMPTGRGSPAGYALLIGEPVIVDDMTADTRFEVPAILREHEVMSYITVVIDWHGNPFGTLAAASTKQRTFSEDDVSFMQSVANVLATAVERMDTEDRLEAAREAERSRIARALHDEALQALTDAIVLAIGAASGPRPSGELLSALRRVGEQLRGAIYDLRSGTEGQRPFVELLEDLVDEHRVAAGDCEIELELGGGVPSGSLGDRGLDVLRIAGEALTNARRHADARHVRVRVWGANAALWVEVSDDGRGFDTTTPSSALHHGIAGMQERAELLGGHLEIHSEPGIGSSVRLESIPFTASREI